MRDEIAVKKDYSVPSFKKWGSVKDLTRGNGGLDTDNSGSFEPT